MERFVINVGRFFAGSLVGLVAGLGLGIAASERLAPGAVLEFDPPAEEDWPEPPLTIMEHQTWPQPYRTDSGSP